MMGVTGNSYLNWEKNQLQPRISMYPAIYAFLGGDPLPAPVLLPDRLKRFRQRRGLSVESAIRPVDHPGG
jgi:hypothetical protein